jgi:hypothetical protein
MSLLRILSVSFLVLQCHAYRMFGIAASHIHHHTISDYNAATTQSLSQSYSALASTPKTTAFDGNGSPCKIKVIGVGGGGGNAVNRMIGNAAGVPGVEMWTVNTDAQALSKSLAPHKLNIGKTTSRYASYIILWS